MKVDVDKIGRFDGKKITKILRVYICEMKVHQLQEYRIIQTFDLVTIAKIHERILEIYKIASMILWAIFDERFKDEYSK